MLFRSPNAPVVQKRHMLPLEMNGCETVKVNRTGLTLFYFQYSIEKQSYKKSFIVSQHGKKVECLWGSSIHRHYLDGPVSHAVIKHLENKQLFSKRG